MKTARVALLGQEPKAIRLENLILSIKNLKIDFWNFPIFKLLWNKSCVFWERKSFKSLALNSSIEITNKLEKEKRF